MTTDTLRLLELAEEEVALLRLYPSQRYIPCGAISAWIDAVGAHDQDSGRVVTYLLSGANGVGKTRALSEMGAALLRGPQSDWLDRPLFRDFSRPCRVRLISTQAALEEGALRELRELLAADIAPGYPKRGGCTWDSEWVLRDGSRLDAYSWQQGITTHAGASVDAVLLDEPGPRAIYDEATARLRGGGPVIWGLTPVDGRGGSSADVGWLFDEIGRAEGSPDPTWRVCYADAEDSCIEHGVRGRVRHEVIADRMRRWEHDPATLQARFYGRHALELGRVLREWDDARHIYTDRDVRVHPSWPRYCSIDTHPSKPQVIVYGALDPFHTFWQIREVVSTALISEVAQELRNVFLAYGFPMLTLIDPLASTPNPVTGETIMDVYRRHLPGANIGSAGREKAEKGVGIAKLREMLAGVGGRPLLRVHESCKYTISQAKRWMIDPRTLAPAKENDDAWECLYRIALNLPAFPTQAMTDALRRMPTVRSSLVV